MKTFSNVLLIWLISLVWLGLSLLSLSVVSAAGQVSPASTYLAAGDIPYILVDDFKDGDWTNELGETNSCDTGAIGSISCSISATVAHSYVEMKYNVITPTAQAWLRMNLGNIDLSAMDSVWIVIRGENGGEEVAAEFVDCNEAVFPKVKFSDYLSGGITTEWRTAAIPLNAFTGISDWSCVNRFNIVANSDLPSVSGTIQVEDVRILPPIVLIDDFHDPERENELGGNSGRWNKYSDVTFTYKYTGGVLELDYDVTTSPTVEASYWTDLRNTNLLLQKEALFFKIQGDQGSEKIEVEFIDCEETHYPKIKVIDYLVGGITTGWRGVAIPLAAFTTDDMDWTCVARFSFRVSAYPEFNSGQGKVRVDDVELVPANALPCRLPIVVDHFHDDYHWNALNGEWSSLIAGTAEFTAVLDPVNRRGNYGYGYRFTYDIPDGSSGWTWTDLKGLDVTDYSHLEFYIKGKDGGEASHVYLGDRKGKARYITIEATKNWQRVLIPLSYFTPRVDLTNLSEVKFAYEWSRMIGEVYIDDISFVQPCIRLPIILKAAPTELYVHNDNTGGNVNVKVHGTTINCDIPDGKEKYCGSFPAGTYTVKATASCGTTIEQITFPCGTETITVSCP